MLIPFQAVPHDSEIDWASDKLHVVNRQEQAGSSWREVEDLGAVNTACFEFPVLGLHPEADHLRGIAVPVPCWGGKIKHWLWGDVKHLSTNSIRPSRIETFMGPG